MGAAPKELRCERGTKRWNKSVKCVLVERKESVLLCVVTELEGGAAPGAQPCPDPVDCHRFLSGFAKGPLLPSVSTLPLPHPFN